MKKAPPPPKFLNLSAYLKKTLYGELKRGDTGELDQNQRPAYDPVLAQKTYQENIRRRGRRRKEVDA